MTTPFWRAAVGLAVGIITTLPHIGGTGIGRNVVRPALAQDVRFDPIPSVDASVASEAELRRVYEFAAHNEHLLKYIPCFCGCETAGHKSVESCFISARTPDGSVKWNKHGAGCRLCLDVVESARELHAAGHPVRDIRQLVIERFYKTRMTPTPKFPGGHATHAPVTQRRGSGELSNR